MPEIKPGMWRMRNGGIACVEYVSALIEKYPVSGALINDGDLGYASWTAEGRDQSYVECGRYDLVEFLSDEIADPRTWKPKIVLKPGIWEREDGSRVLVSWRGGRASWAVYSWDACMVYADYMDDGTHGSGIASIPRIVKYLGPNPLDP